MSRVDWGVLLDGLFEGIRPFLPILIPMIVLIAIAAVPLPGRGPGLQGCDPWRGFKFEARRVVLTLAGHRCEGVLFLVWGRCRKPAEEVDHIYPWSKGGATIISNGQALCKNHNRAKSNGLPPWWYVLSLERRRGEYYPAGTSVRVSAALTAADKAARAERAARAKR